MLCDVCLGTLDLEWLLSSRGREGVLYIGSKLTSGLKTVLAGFCFALQFGGSPGVSATSM